MTKRKVAAVVAMGTVLFASGCSAFGGDPDDGSTPSADPTSDAPATYEGKPLADLDLSEIPLATSPTADQEARTDVVGLTDGRLLTTKPEQIENVIVLEALDVETGEVAWDVNLAESRQIAIDAGVDIGRSGRPTGRLELSDATAQREGGDAVFVPVFGNVCIDGGCSNQADIGDYDGGYRSGIVALNANDGSVMWASDLTPALGDGLQGISLHPKVVDAAGDVAVANVEAQTTDGEDTTVVVALDTETGEVRWVQRDVVASAVSAGVVAAVRPTDTRGDEGELVGLDAANGDELWTVDKPGSWIAAGARGDLAPVALPEADIVDLRTGEFVRMGRFPVEPALGVGDDAAFVAWLDTSGDGTLFSYDDGGSAAVMGETSLAGDAVAAIGRDGYLWISSGGDDPTITAADRTGRTHSDPVAGDLVDARDGSIVTVTPDTAVHLWRYAGK